MFWHRRASLSRGREVSEISMRKLCRRSIIEREFPKKLNGPFELRTSILWPSGGDIRFGCPRSIREWSIPRKRRLRNSDWVSHVPAWARSRPNPKASLRDSKTSVGSSYLGTCAMLFHVCAGQVRRWLWSKWISSDGDLIVQRARSYVYNVEKITSHGKTGSGETFSCATRGASMRNLNGTMTPSVTFLPNCFTSTWASM